MATYILAEVVEDDEMTQDSHRKSEVRHLPDSELRFTDEDNVDVTAPEISLADSLEGPNCHHPQQALDRNPVLESSLF